MALTDTPDRQSEISIWYQQFDMASNDRTVNQPEAAPFRARTTTRLELTAIELPSTLICVKALSNLRLSATDNGVFGFTLRNRRRSLSQFRRAIASIPDTCRALARTAARFASSGVARSIFSRAPAHSRGCSGLVSGKFMSNLECRNHFNEPDFLNQSPLHCHRAPEGKMDDAQRT